MASAKRQPGEKFSAYRKRLRNEQDRIRSQARGRLIFQSTEFVPHPVTGQMVAVGIASAKAVRDGKLNKKHGRRLATGYVPA